MLQFNISGYLLFVCVPEGPIAVQPSIVEAEGLVETGHPAVGLVEVPALPAHPLLPHPFTTPAAPLLAPPLRTVQLTPRVQEFTFRSIDVALEGE